MQTTSKVDVRHEVADSCNGLQWDSSQDDIDKVDGATMEEGWQCMRETVTYAFTRREGDGGNDWFDLGNASTPTFVGWHFKTLHKSWGTSGKLTVNLNYHKWKNIQEDQTTSNGVVINWGDVKALTIPPASSWKIIYTQFDGSIKEYVAADQTNPYLQISTAGNQISIKVVPQ